MKYFAITKNKSHVPNPEWYKQSITQMDIIVQIFVLEENI